MATTNAVDNTATQHAALGSHLSVEDSPSLVLVVSSTARDRHTLAQVLSLHGCPRYWVSTLREAVQWLSTNRARLIICEDSLPDGGWQELWDHVRLLPEPPVFVVSTQWTDAHLWAEVLNLGAYDVLVKPYEHSEVRRVLQQACRRSRYFA